MNAFWACETVCNGLDLKIKDAQHGRMWQRSYGVFDCTYACRTTQRILSLFHQILFAIPTSLRNNENVHKCLVEKYSNRKGWLIFS